MDHDEVAAAENSMPHLLRLIAVQLLRSEVVKRWNATSPHLDSLTEINTTPCSAPKGILSFPRTRKIWFAARTLHGWRKLAHAPGNAPAR
jgi:hypothetical protein